MTLRDSQPDEAGYEVLAPLSSGTYGENLVAVRREPLGLGKLFVLRQLRRSLSGDAAVRAAFVDMGRRAVRLSHPNIIDTFELGERGGALFAVTEYLEGEPLDAIMAAIARAPDAVDVRLWLLIACEALSGLHHAHEARDFDGTKLGLVHGGVTPRRIFVTYAGRVVVTDFGLAALAAHAKRVEGTFLPEMVAYTAPEQRRGLASDARTDVYAIGLVLWELLSGRRHRHAAETDAAAEFEPMPSLREIRPELDRQLASIVMRAIEIDPDARFATAAEFRTALEPFVDRGRIIRRAALGEAIAALFAKTRDKIPSLLSKRSTSIAPQAPTAVSIAPPVIKRDKERAAEADEDAEAEEAPFLLSAPIEAVSEANFISVTELVSDSELLSSVELIGSGSTLRGDEQADSARASEEAGPDSTMPLSLKDLEPPVERSSETVSDLADLSDPTPSSNSPDSGARPTLANPPTPNPANDAPEERDIDATESAPKSDETTPDKESEKSAKQNEQSEEG